MRKLSRRGRSVVVGFSALALGLLALAAAALADNVQTNDVDTSGSATKAAGGSGTASVRIVGNSSPTGDPNGCNVSTSNPATVTLNSNQSWLTFTSSNSLSFTACGTGSNPEIKTVDYAVDCEAPAGGVATVSTSTTDASTATLYNEGSFTVTVSGVDSSCTPPNADPTADAGGPYSGDEGSEITLNGSGSSDDGTIASYKWSVAPQSGGSNDPDAGAACSFKNGVDTGVSPVIICTDDGNYDVSLTVTDDKGATDNDTVVATVKNANPVIDSVANTGPIDEGGSANITVTRHDPGTNDNGALTTSYDCDGNGTYENTSGTCSFADDDTFAVGVQVTDGDGGSATSTTNVVVKNVAPAVGALTVGGGGGTACVGGNTATLDFGFTDPGVNDNPWAVDIDWGDGSSHTTYNASSQGAQPQRSHTYAAGTYTIKVKVTDKDGDSGNSAATDGGVSFLYNVSGILPPFNANGTSNFKLGSTTPVKIKVLDCDGVSVSNLSPDVSLKKYDPNPDGDVNEVVSSSAADTGNQMRYDPSGQQYIFNLSTKLSGFGIGVPLTPSPGTYEVKASDASFGSASQKFDLKK
jgi:PKD domain